MYFFSLKERYYVVKNDKKRIKTSKFLPSLFISEEKREQCDMRVDGYSVKRGTSLGNIYPIFC